jgi:hypothetical protein
MYDEAYNALGMAEEPNKWYTITAETHKAQTAQCRRTIFINQGYTAYTLQYQHKRVQVYIDNKVRNEVYRHYGSTDRNSGQEGMAKKTDRKVQAMGRRHRGRRRKIGECQVYS